MAAADFILPPLWIADADQKVTMCCVNGIIDIFIGKESGRKDDDDIKDDGGKKSGRGKNAGSRFNG